MIRNRQPIVAGAVLAIVALVLAACSSSGGRAADEQANEGSGTNSADTPRMRIAMVTHEAPGDTFWTIVRRGAEDAAAKDNVELVYSNDDEGGRQANLVRNAINSDVDGIAVTLAKPDAMADAVRAATEADIPVVALNSGMEAWEDLGALMFFGQDEYVAGEAAGERLAEDGANKVVCVIHEQGHVGLEARCEGARDAFGGEAEVLYVNGTSMPSVKSSLTAKLQEDADVDRVLTLGAPFAMTAVDAVSDAGSDAEVVTFDTNAELVGAIESGDVSWAVDQQPYLQGYLAIDSLWLHNTNAHTIGGEQAVLTGPSFVTDENIDEIAEYAENGTR